MDTDFAALADAARTAPQLDVATEAGNRHLPAHGMNVRLEVAAYQAAIREGRPHFFVQLASGGFLAYTDLDEAVEAYQQIRPGVRPAHKRFEPTGEIVDVKADGTEKAPRAGYLAGLAEDIAALTAKAR